MTQSEFLYKTPFNATMRYGAGGIICLGGVALLTIFVAAAGIQDNRMGPIFGIVGAVLLFMVGIYVFTISVFIRADETTLSLGLSPWPKSSFGWNDVETVEKVDIGFFSAMGIGYRITGVKSRAVLARPGRGIRFILKDGRSFSVVCDEKTDELAEIARTHI